MHRVHLYSIIFCSILVAHGLVYGSESKIAPLAIARDQLPQLLATAPSSLVPVAQHWATILKRDGIWNLLHQECLTTEQASTINKALQDHNQQKAQMWNLSTTGNITTPIFLKDKDGLPCAKDYVVHHPGPWHYLDNDKASLGKGWTDSVSTQDYEQAKKQGIVMPTTRYQGISRAYYALQAQHVKKELGLNLIEIPQVFLVPTTTTPSRAVNDHNYVVVQKWTNGSLLNEVKPESLSDKALAQVSKLIAAGLWNCTWHNFVVTPQGTIAPINFEQPPSIKPEENPLSDEHDPILVARRLSSTVESGRKSWKETLERLQKDPNKFL